MGTIQADVITGVGNNSEVTFVSNKFTGSTACNLTVTGEG